MNEIKLPLKNFFIHGEFISKGYDTGERWNGWACPTFSRDQWLRMITGETLKNMGIDYIEHENSLVNRAECFCDDPECVDLGCDQREAWPIDAKGFCEFGAGAWVWSCHAPFCYADILPEYLDVFDFLLDDWTRRVGGRDTDDLLEYMAEEFDLKSVDELNEHLRAHIQIVEEETPSEYGADIVNGLHDLKIRHYSELEEYETDLLREAIDLIRTHVLDENHPLAIN